MRDRIKGSGLKMKDRHILQIFNRYLQYGGEEGSVARIGAMLKELYEVKRFSLATSDMIGQGFLSDLQLPVSVIHNTKVLKALEEMQRKDKFDAWQVHNVFPAASPAVYQKAFEWGIPVVQYLHNYRMSCTNGFFINHGQPCERCIHGNFLPALVTACWKDSHAISGMMGLVLTRMRQLKTFEKVAAWVALSEAQKQQHVKMGIPEERIWVIPHFYEIKEEPLPMGDASNVLFLGRLSKEKGVDRLIQAWATVNSKSGELLIMGEGPEKESLLQLVKDLGLKNVRFLGFVAAKDQAALWANVGFIVVPSIWMDPLPSVVFEAWGRGRAVIVHKIGGLAEIVDHGIDGLVADPNCMDSLAQKIGELLGRPERCSALAKEGREKIITKYNVSLWKNKTDKLYESVLGSRSTEDRRLVLRSGTLSKLKILVVAQTPPPVHGQAVMTQYFLDGQYKKIDLIHVRMGFSNDIKEVGVFKFKKLIRLFILVLRIAYTKVTTGADVLYYPPSGPKKTSFYKDVVVLLAVRWMFRRTIFHFYAAGICDIYHELPWWGKRLYRWAYSKADRGIVLYGEGARDPDFLKCRNSFVVPCGIPEVGGSQDAVVMVKPTPHVVTYLAMLSEGKGVLIFLEACAELLKRGIEIKPVLVGWAESDDFEMVLSTRIHELGLADCLERHGKTLGEKKHDIYRRTSIFCFPTHYASEGSPVVLLEAMQFGLPIVATRWRGIIDTVVEGETGFLVPARDPIAVADKLECLVKDDSLRQRMGLAARMRYEEHYRVQAFRGKMEEVLVETETR